MAFKIFRYFVRGRIISRFFKNLTVPLDLSDSIQAVAYWQGERYEYPTPRLIGNLIVRHNCRAFFDIGANFGFYSYYIKSKNPSLSIVAFEPNPVNYARMMEVKKYNDLPDFSPQNIALGDQNEFLTLNSTLDNSGHSSFGENLHYQSKEHLIKKIEIPVKPFDDWRKDSNIAIPPRLSWAAKIDVEGFELKVLGGMKETLQAGYFKFLCIEINSHTLNFFKNDAADIFRFLETYGYMAYDENFIRTSASTKEMRNVYFLYE